MENWQSEYLQFLVFLLATIWVPQRDPRSQSLSMNPGASPTRIG